MYNLDAHLVPTWVVGKKRGEVVFEGSFMAKMEINVDKWEKWDMLQPRKR